MEASTTDAPAPADPDAVADDAEAVEAAVAATEELAVRAVGIGQRLRGTFDPGQMELIRQTVAKDCNEAQLAMFLEICARYQLDPFSKQIWAVKMSGGLTIMVSRDGLLALANRSEDFRGLDGDVVRENDEYVKQHGPGGLTVEHKVTQAGAEKRGAIVGAWAVVHRVNRVPTYFFAELGQYKRGDNTPWGKQTDAMILKVAESMALRKAFSISGVVGEDEMAPRLSITAAGEARTPEVEWPEDDDLREELQSAFRVLGYTVAKQRLLVNGKTTEELIALANDLDVEGEGEQVEGEVVG